MKTHFSFSNRKQNSLIILYQMNFRSNVGTSYYDQNKLGHSSASRNYGLSQRNPNYNYDDQNNFGEIEFMLENQRKKFKDAKQKFQYDLDNERKLRIEFQNKLIKVKDQFSRKEVTISELEFKINNLLHQNQDVIVENQRLRSQLVRFEDLYGGKIHELETQLSMDNKNYDEMTNQYNSQFEKFKKEGQQYVEQITFDFERKIKSLEERVKSSENIKREITLQNKKLNDILISNKLTFEEQVRDLKNKAREDQIKKIQNVGKSYQQKLKMVEQSKQSIIRKNQQLLRHIQDKDRKIQDIQAEKSDEIGQLNQDNSDMSQQLNHLNYIVNKLKSQLLEKDSMIGKGLNENQHQIKNIRQQAQMKKQQNAQLTSTIRDLRMSHKQYEGQWQRRRRQLTQRCNIHESQAKKYKEQYQRICEMLKSRINDTINNTVTYKK